MSSFVGTKWDNANYGLNSSSGKKSKYKSGTLEGTLSNLSCIKQNIGDKPILLFVESSEVIRKGSKKSKSKPKDSKQKVRSEKAYSDVFLDPELKVQIASQLFTCIRMDVARVKAEDNPILCSKEAPIIAIYAKDGTLKKVLDGSLKSTTVFSAMRTATRTKSFNIDQMLGEVYKVMDRLYKNEVKLYNAKVDLAETRKKYSKKTSKSATEKIKKEQKVVSDIEYANEKIKSECSEITAKYKI